MTGLYVHVPFCAALCPYCDFAVVIGREHLHGAYLDALRAEFAAAPALGPFDTVFIGGGTPSVIEPDALADLIAWFRARGPVTEDAEITIEANPESVSEDGLQALARAGVNRVSIGGQSGADHVLRSLGREHTARATSDAVAAARAAGIASINVDLIYGAAEESEDDWRRSLDDVIALGVEHVSCYGLMIEPNTPFGRATARGERRVADDEVLAARYELACEALDAAGYEHYETSNWARPGHACRHNIATWRQGDYLGLGIGAPSHADGHRWWNTRSIGAYLDAPEAARAGEERLDDRARAEEWLSLGIRLGDGVGIEEASARLGRGIVPAVDSLAAAGLLHVSVGRARLTIRGHLLETDVTGRLLALSTR